LITFKVGFEVPGSLTLAGSEQLLQQHLRL
jgi:hypothetical protein